MRKRPERGPLDCPGGGHEDAERKGHTEEQILQALPFRRRAGGKKATEICRKLGISEQTFYTWKRKYTGLGLNELRELRQLLRDENGKLKKLVAGSIAGSTHAAGDRPKKAPYKASAPARIGALDATDPSGQASTSSVEGCF